MIYSFERRVGDFLIKQGDIQSAFEKGTCCYEPFVPKWWYGGGLFIM